jgi:hypothetical protein
MPTYVFVNSGGMQNRMSATTTEVVDGPNGGGARNNTIAAKVGTARPMSPMLLATAPPRPMFPETHADGTELLELVGLFHATAYVAS